MADTTFVDNVISAANRIVSAWLNTINNYVYRATNPIFVTSTGAANAYTITLPATSLLAAISDGMFLEWKPNFTNTGSATLTIVGASSLTALALKCNGVALAGGEIRSGVPIRGVVVGTDFHIIGNFAGGTLPGDVTLSGKINKLTLTPPATGATLTIADDVTFTVDKSLEFDGTAGTKMTFPSTSATIARTDASNTFTGTQTINGDVLFTDATYDIGKTGATRPRDLFLSRNETLAGVLTSTNVTTTTSPTTGSVILAGGVGIAGKLWVGANFNVQSDITAHGGICGLFFERRDNSAITDGFYATGGNIVVNNSSAGAIANIAEATGVYTAISNKDKKKDDEPFPYGLKEILATQPVLYRMVWESSDVPKHGGFFAQDLKDKIPPAYVETPDGFIGFDPIPIIAALSNAARELNTRLVALESSRPSV